MMIIQECKLNMFYYLREVVRIEEDGGNIVHFRMDRGTLAACYCFYNNINFYLMKPRQTGKTVGINAMLSWALMRIWCPYIVIYRYNTSLIAGTTR